MTIETIYSVACIIVALQTLALTKLAVHKTEKVLWWGLHVLALFEFLTSL